MEQRTNDKKPYKIRELNFWKPIPREGQATRLAPSAPRNNPPDPLVLPYIPLLAGEVTTILQRGKISPRLLTKPTFPPNRSSSRWGRTIPWVSHILYLIGEGMRSAGSTNAHCS